ncbi:MAG: NADH:flavin oxidoreductase/NADH oxidase, partial [Pyrinomonadaceae bacterium]|nr:NADH:flavin oxidoreductase/NADH oxidase [Pyrinomonadaceae bacterium]
IQEATAVSPEGRITAGDAGIWSDEHAEAYKKIVTFIKSQGAIAGIQLAHAGRKASTAKPWEGGKGVDESNGGWQTVAPTAEKFAHDYPQPVEMTKVDIEKVTKDFIAATKRSLDAGFEVIEIHAAHGYLFHEFLSPLSNKRTDEYGGSLENRMRLLLETTEKVREIVPQNLPVFVRISATDWTENGWTVDDSVELCKRLKGLNIDLIDVSTGGNVERANIPSNAGYQVPFAAEIRAKAAIKTGAVGLITEARHAEQILQNDEADAIFIAREFLRDPYFPFNAAQELGEKLDYVPKQYGRAIEFEDAQEVKSAAK